MINRNLILKELFKVRNPHLKSNASKKALNELGKRVYSKIGNKKALLSKKAFIELTTARNRNLITPREQNILRKSIIGFFGMSVGSHAALTWMMISKADILKIADPDIVSPTNLNRLRLGWNSLGKFKCDLVKDQLAEINPYSKIFTLTKTDLYSMEKFINNKPLPELIVDEIDDFESKLLLRQQSKILKIPLISAADIGNNVMVDIERYDLEPNLYYFNGRIKNADKIRFDQLTNLQKKKLIIELVGFEHNSLKMLESLMAIEGSIVSWPQLGSTATIAGGIIATLIQNILLGGNIKSGRYYVSLDSIFTHEDYEAESEMRERRINELNQILKKA